MLPILFAILIWPAVPSLNATKFHWQLDHPIMTKSLPRNFSLAGIDAVVGTSTHQNLEQAWQLHQKFLGFVISLWT